MKLKIITYATETTSGFVELKRSLDYFKLDYDVIGVGDVWKGFGTKPIKVLEHLKNLSQDYTHCIFVDAYDTFFLGGESKIKPQLSAMLSIRKEKIIFSTEKACWPESDLADQYPTKKSYSPWKYLNSGMWAAEIWYAIKLLESCGIQYPDDDQGFFTHHYLEQPGTISLDVNCRLFQSIAFEDKEDFTFVPTTKKLLNARTFTWPLIIHGNGRTDMSKIYNLL